MLATILLSLWGIETIASVFVACRTMDKFPLTALILLARAGLYIAMAADWLMLGPDHYRLGHLATALVFRLMTVLMCLESVWLMAQGIPSVRCFAAVTSLLFAGLGIVVAMATSGLFHGAWIDAPLGNNVAAYRNLTVACVVYLMANHWLYDRAQPWGTLATQHWRGAVVLVSCLMIGYGMEDWGGTRQIAGFAISKWMAYWLVVGGQFVVRGGSLWALWIWGRRARLQS